MRKENKMTLDSIPFGSGWYLITSVPLTEEETQDLENKYNIEVWQVSEGLK